MGYNKIEINSDISKFKRGQVWWINKDIEEEKEKILNPNIFTVAKSRPWLIVSNDYDNANSGKITCTPLLTVHNDRFSNNSVEITIDGVKRIARCSEIQTFNWVEVNGNYIGTVSNVIMNRVDEALNRYLSVNATPSTKYIESLIEKRLAINKQNASEMKEIIEKLKILLNEEMKVSEMISNTDSKPVSDDDVVKPTVCVIPNSNSGLKSTNKKSGYSSKKKCSSRWTNERITSFVNDYLNLGLKETAKKYGLTENTTQNYYSKFYKQVKFSNKIKELV